MTIDLTHKRIYIPQMSFVASKMMSATFQACGIDAHPLPNSDARTLELAGKFTSGEECYPEIITLGNTLKVIEAPDFDPKRTAFLLPTSGGPCRFGQYRNLWLQVFREKGLPNLPIISPTSSDGYEGFGSHATVLLRFGWWAIILSDILRKLLLKTRPYESEKGTTDIVYQQCLADICETLAIQNQSGRQKKAALVKTLYAVREQFQNIPANYVRDSRFLVGIVGEIFCRLNDFSNNFIIEKIESLGGEVWISDISEWVWYVNDEQLLRIVRKGKRFSTEYLIAKIKLLVQKLDEHQFMAPFKKDFIGYEEAPKVRQIMDLSEPYLPQDGALGEMVSSVGKALYLQTKGA
ncbi:hypothetical protein KAH55_02500, partial [bacterium]|nr:hypothetical protein [bacterium]